MSWRASSRSWTYPVVARGILGALVRREYLSELKPDPARGLRLTVDNGREHQEPWRIDVHRGGTALPHRSVKAREPRHADPASNSEEQHEAPLPARGLDHGHGRDIDGVGLCGAQGGTTRSRKGKSKSRLSVRGR